MSPGRAAISIIVPAFREAPNIDPLVRRIFEATGRAGFDAELIIVDDDSQDGTVEIVKQLGAEFPVRVCVRTDERGLATAVLRGLSESENEILVVMDADLQHPPERIGDLVRPITEGRAEFVVASRYVPGARIEEGWSIWRKINSRAATLLARPLTRVRDPLSGFFALRRGLWERADRLNPVGYKIGLELLVKSRTRSVAEVPISFATRPAGDSKLSFGEQLRYLRHLLRLYWFRFRWVMVGAVVLSAVLIGFALRAPGS